MYFFKKQREEDKRMKKKVLAFLLASTMIIEPFTVANAADFSDGIGQDTVQFSDDVEDVPEVENDDVDQFSTDAVGKGELPAETHVRIGDNVWVDFDNDDGIATISGNGAMWDYMDDGWDSKGDNQNPFAKIRDSHNNISIKKIIISDGIINIGNYFLYDYTKYDDYNSVEVLLGSSVKKIGKYAFGGCNIHTITLPGGLEELGDSSFYDCSLREVTLPESIKSIGDNCFSNCYSLKKVVLSDSLTNIPKGMFSSCDNLEKIILPSKLKILGERAFSSCINLTGVTLPSTLETLGVEAFQSCKSLIEITLPSSLKEVEEDAFDTSGAFSNCVNLKKVNIEPGFSANIPGMMFGNCKFLTEISIPENISYVGSCAFYNCDRLATITINGAKTKISSDAFRDCKNLNTIESFDCSYAKKNAEENNIHFNSLGEGTHQWSAEKEVIKEPTCTEEGLNVYRCEICGATKAASNSLAYDHNWDNGVITKLATETEEGEIKYTCRRCNETKTESIPKIPKQEDKLKITGQEMKWLDHNSAELKFQSNVKGTYYIEKVKRGEKAPKIDITQAGTPVEANTTVTAEVTDLPEYDVDIYVCIVSESDKSNYSATVFQPISSERPSKVVDTVKVGDNAVATINGDTLTITGSGTTYDESGCFHEVNKSQIKHIVVSDGITYLGDSLFFQFGMVEDVELPTSLNGIGYSAFANCTALTNLTLPDSIITIRGEAFSNCSTLDKITLPSKLTSLGYDVFEGCNAEIIFPSSLKCIPELGNNAVKKVEIPEGVEIIEEEAFWGCSNLIKITLPSTITSIGKGAFLGTGITSFNYPQNITNIPNIAFQNTNLKEFSVPEKVTEIGDSAFYDCADLEKITIPKSVTYIGTGAFAKCRNLTIYGFKDSAAEAYAKANTIKFVSADYKVIFKDNGRTQKIEYVTKGQNATPPTLDAKAGYALSWDADYTNITEDMVINAVWTKKDSGNGGGNTTIIVSPSETNKYTVTFKDRGKIVKTEKVKSGDAAEYPYINRNGYELSWDKDFSKVTANITVNAVWTIIKPNKVTSLTAEVQKNSIDLSWDRAENTDYYLVYRKTTSDTEYKQIKKTTKILWTDEDVEPGTEYSYKVVGVCSVDGKKYQGADSDIVIAKIGTPQIGDVYSVGDLKYKVTGAKEVSVIGLAKEEVEIKIPSAVSISGKAYKVTSVQDKAFYQNEDIVSIAIGNNVTYVGKYAFYQCPNMETVKFGKRVSVISTCAFTQCKNLENLTLPSSIRRIGAKAFYQCTSIKVLKINGANLEYVGKKGLAVNKSVTLRLPKKVYTRYKKLIKASGIYSKTKFVKF